MTQPLCIAVFVSTAFALPARATTFDEATVQRLRASSDLIVLGRVERVEVFARGPAGQPGIHTRATIRVGETLRGEDRDTVEVWAHGGRLGRRMRLVPGQASFRAGERVVLFLFRAGGGLWPTGMGRGKWPVDGEDARASVRPPRVEGSPVDERTTISLSDLRALVAGSTSADRTEARP